MKRVAAVSTVLALTLVGVALYVVETSPPWFERLRYPLHYTSIVRERAKAEGIDPALLAAVIYQESKFRPTARSRSGAIGLMQLTPSTARGIALRTGGTAFRVSDLTDPAINIRYGTWYLHDLFAKYGSLRLVLAAYNAGEGNVDRWRRAGEGIQFPETRAYIDRVVHLERVYRDAWRAQLYPALP
jgi:soluble lytic murein transglycosylase